VTTIQVELDAQTENGLRRLIQREGEDVADVAARLLARAVRIARPRPVFDTEAIKTANAEFVEEDALLAESGSEERAELLAQEDHE
jgi:hypothetical protein